MCTYFIYSSVLLYVEAWVSFVLHVCVTVSTVLLAAENKCAHPDSWCDACSSACMCNNSAAATRAKHQVLRCALMQITWWKGFFSIHSKEAPECWKLASVRKVKGTTEVSKGPEEKSF